MVWCVFSKMEIIGPCFFEGGNVTGSKYKRMLLCFLLHKLRDYPKIMIVRQDGAPLHYVNEVREYLNRMLPGRWMGSGGPISWPARSPDLTPCVYYLWRQLKDIVYWDPSQTIKELKTKIREGIRVINENTLKRVFKNIKTRLGFVIREKGRHFEHIMN